MVRIHEYVKFQAIKSDWNKNSGQESILFLMLPQTLREHAQLKKNKKKTAKNRKL